MNARDFALLELFKNVPFRNGIDPLTAIKAIQASLFKADGSSNAIPHEELAKRWGVSAAGAALSKAFVQSGSATSGLTQYDLEQGAKLLYPVTTIFRNMIPRITGGLGIQANWRSVTAINPGQVNAGLSEGHRGPAMAQTVVDRYAAFKTSGLDNFVTEQAYLAALTFEDLYSLAATTTLQGVMEQEEHFDIGANSSLLLGTGATPTQGAVLSSGGALSNATYSVIVVPLTYFGMVNSSPPTEAADLSLSGGAVALPYTRANMDGSTDLIQGFTGIPSAAASIALSGGNSVQTLNVATTAVRGAIGYAWFLQAGGTGSERLVAITGYPTAAIKATNSTGQLVTALPATDTSTNSLNYDGMLTQILTAGSGAYWKDLGGAALTSAGTGTGGITEFNTALASFYDNYRLIPTDIFMNGYDQQKAGQLILNGNTNLAPFFMSGTGGQLQASTVLTEYINPIGFGNTRLQVHAHPFIPRGTVIFYSRTNPYPLSNVPALIRKLLRRDYWQVDWPVVTLNKTMGMYFDGVLQMYFNPAFGAITGIKM